MDSAIAGNIISGMPEADYFALPRLSQSAIKKILHSPAHYKHAQDKESAAMKQGSLIDVALTEPESLDTNYHVIDNSIIQNKRHKAYQEIMDAAGDKVIVKQSDMDAALRVRDAVQSHPIAQQLLENVVSQQVALWTEQTDYGPVDMKARIDWANPDMNVLIDLKSTDDARAFPKKASNFGYHIQDACYRHGWQEAGGWPVDAFVFVVVEREIPHGIKLYELNQRARDLGWRQYRRGVETYAKCKQNDNWYCYDPMIDEVDLPGWSYYEDEQNGED